MRAFIAIELSPEIKDYLSRLQDKLKTAQSEVKWVAPKNIHLTLKFLGEIDEQAKDNAIKIMEDVVKDKEQFYLTIASLGAFPRLESPRIIWVGINQGDLRVKEIARQLDEKLFTLGIAQENKPFSSHVTLGRTRSSNNLGHLTERIQSLTTNTTTNFPGMRVDKITLYKSTLTPKGPIYEIIKESYLLK